MRKYSQVLSLFVLISKNSGVVGFLGFNHDRKLALRALAVSAAKTDVHAVFAGSVFSMNNLLVSVNLFVLDCRL